MAQQRPHANVASADLHIGQGAQAITRYRKPGWLP